MQIGLGREVSLLANVNLGPQRISQEEALLISIPTYGKSAVEQVGVTSLEGNRLFVRHMNFGFRAAVGVGEVVAVGNRDNWQIPRNMGVDAKTPSEYIRLLPRFGMQSNALAIANVKGRAVVMSGEGWGESDYTPTMVLEERGWELPSFYPGFWNRSDSYCRRLILEDRYGKRYSASGWSGLMTRMSAVLRMAPELMRNEGRMFWKTIQKREIPNPFGIGRRAWDTAYPVYKQIAETGEQVDINTLRRPLLQITRKMHDYRFDELRLHLFWFRMRHDKFSWREIR